MTEGLPAVGGSVPWVTGKKFSSSMKPCAMWESPTCYLEMSTSCLESLPWETGRSAWLASPANVVEGSVLGVGVGVAGASPQLLSHVQVCVRVLCYHLCEDAFWIKTKGHESKMPIPSHMRECFFFENFAPVCSTL